MVLYLKSMIPQLPVFFPKLFKLLLGTVIVMHINFQSLNMKVEVLYRAQRNLILSLPRVPYGTESHYLLNIGSICIKFHGHQTDLGEICIMEA